MEAGDGMNVIVRRKLKLKGMASAEASKVGIGPTHLLSREQCA